MLGGQRQRFGQRWSLSQLEECPEYIYDHFGNTSRTTSPHLYFPGGPRHDFAREKPLGELSSALLGNHDCQAESGPRQREQQPSAFEETDVRPGERSGTLINLYQIHFTN